MGAALGICIPNVCFAAGAREEEGKWGERVSAMNRAHAPVHPSATHSECIVQPGGSTTAGTCGAGGWLASGFAMTTPALYCVVVVVV